MKEWPKNWRELLAGTQSCDCCGNCMIPILYHLCVEQPDLLVCSSCAESYHDHKMIFIKKVMKNKLDREEFKKTTLVN